MKTAANERRLTRQQISAGLWIPCCIVALLAATSAADDWPTFQHDNARGAHTSEKLTLPLAEQWVYRSRQPPIPAWDEPATWDGWHKIHNLKNRQVFDKAFHVAAVGDAIFFGSSVDDKVYCLNAISGSLRWTFHTEAPVRLAPSVVNGKVYVGSDDGYVYCLDQATGRQIWKHRVGPVDTRVPGNGRIVSLWAIRTGIVVADGTAYCCAGVIPSESAYVCAMDAETGEELWKTSMNDLPGQGYLLASATRLYVTTGRSSPVVFDRATGKRLFQVSGSGGTYALLAGDRLMYGPGKVGELSLFDANRDYLATFAGSHVIAAAGMFYLQSDNDLRAIDGARYVRVYRRRRELNDKKNKITQQLKKADAEEATGLKKELDNVTSEIKELSAAMDRCIQWTTTCNDSLALILAGDTLLGGGARGVTAIDAASGQLVWQADVQGNAYGLAVANGRLYVSTDEGEIHGFAAADDNNAPTRGTTAQTQPEVSSESVARSETTRPGKAELRGEPGTSGSDDPALRVHGPFLEFIAPQEVRVTWQTDHPTTSVVEFGKKGNELQRYTDNRRTTQHDLTVGGVQRETIYQLRVGSQSPDGRLSMTPPYTFDSHFQYLRHNGVDLPSPYPEDEWTARYDALAKRILDAATTTRGYALVLGSDNGRLAYHLARLSDLQIVIREEDAEKVKRIRTALDAAGLTGSRVSVHHGKLDDLPYGPYFANLVVSDTMLKTGEPPAFADALYRMVRPSGGVIYLGQWSAVDGETSLSREKLATWWGSAQRSEDTSSFIEQDGLFGMCRRGPLPGAGQWTHQYAKPDNAACSDDDLLRADLAVQWWGRPGARPMPDRGNRNPPPVSANGRLYVQGNRTLFGMDAYNGTILWAKQIPTMRRANMPRDGSNMVATDDYLYVAIGRYCTGFEGRTGKRQLNFRVPKTSDAQPYDWGYVANVGQQLLGSGVKQGSHYLGDDGEWYEGSVADHTARVTSDHLFALDRHTGSQQWLYQQGVIMNSTITVADNCVYFVESRSEASLRGDSGRLLDEVQTDQHLVALDLTSGAVKWQRPCDFSKCHQMTYMACSDNTLLVTGTDKGNRFHVYALDAQSGDSLWQHEAPDKKGHHTGHLAHPTIVGPHVYFNKHSYQLRTGDVLGVHDFNWHGCGIMSASRHCIFSRYEYHGVYDIKSGQRREMLGVRSGCWLSLIPSGGLLLAPETGAGCSCTHAIQTSIAYVPRAAQQSTVPASE